VWKRGKVKGGKRGRFKVVGKGLNGKGRVRKAYRIPIVIFAV
jgi:hypothetical protein